MLAAQMSREKKVHVPPKKIPYFKPGKHLREELLHQ